MQELSIQEIDEVAGAVSDFSAGVATGIGIGLAIVGIILCL